MLGPSGPRHLALTSRHFRQWFGPWQLPSIAHIVIASDPRLTYAIVGLAGLGPQKCHDAARDSGFGLVTGDEVGHGIQLAGWALTSSVVASFVVEASHTNLPARSQLDGVRWHRGVFLRMHQLCHSDACGPNRVGAPRSARLDVVPFRYDAHEQKETLRPKLRGIRQEVCLRSLTQDWLCMLESAWRKMGQRATFSALRGQRQVCSHSCGNFTWKLGCIQCRRSPCAFLFGVAVSHATVRILHSPQPGLGVCVLFIVRGA